MRDGTFKTAPGLLLVTILVLIKNHPDLYIIAIQNKLKELNITSASVGAISTTLNRALTQGLVSHRLEETKRRTVGGRRRILYTILPAGIEYIKKSFIMMNTITSYEQQQTTEMTHVG